MKRLMTRHFAKWAKKQDISIEELSKILIGLSSKQINTAVKNGDFIEVII